MATKMVGVGILLTVFSLAGWQVWNLSSGSKPAVLAESTSRTVEERIRLLESRVYNLEKNAGLISSGTKKTPTESFVSLVGGSMAGSDWSKITGTDFTLDTALYGKTVEVSWQGWLEGAGGVRLYDATNHRAVDFSEFVSTSDGQKSFYSKVMAIWRGQNQYYLEGKSAGGTVSLSGPRLRVVVK